MRRTGWENLLQDARRDILIAISDLPALTGRPFCLGVHTGESLFSSAAVEQQLASIMEATDRLFDRCGDTIRCTDVCVRRWLRGRFLDRLYKAPFELISKHSSERIYRKELKRCLCLWLRLLQLPHETTKSILGRAAWEDPAWRVNQAVCSTSTSLLSDISGSDDRSDLDQDEDVDDDAEEDEDEDEGQGSGYGSDNDYADWSGEDIHDSSDGYSSTMDSPGRRTIAPVDPAADLVLRLAYYMVTEDFEDGRSSSTMFVFFSAIRGLSGTDGEEYLRPHRFTPILSRLIYCVRLIFIEATLPQFEHSYVNIACRPRHDRMCDGTMSPMGEFFSLLDYGRALRRSEGPVYHFYWSEDGQTLSWDGQNYLTITQFRSLAHEALRQASAHWIKFHGMQEQHEHT
ncbi:hypothetical protein DER44DRAFT_816686 [Fusarium oxysporum]|nr:hypothetical protein DER44DRAFT_816686 [Fusarium oxysporum]